MKPKLVVKGAFYFNGEEILIPHYTGEFNTVDCTRYLPIRELTERYNDNFIKENEDNFIEYDGDKYYYAECSPYNVGDWDLLSDLSELEHLEEDLIFN